MECCNLRRIFSNFNNERVEKDDGSANFNNERVESTIEREELFCNPKMKGPRVIALLLLSLGLNYVYPSDEQVHVLIGKLVRIQIKIKN
jgi:hypothetical protein